MTRRDWINVLVVVSAVGSGAFFIGQLQGEVNTLKRGPSIDVPGSAVVAFDSAECPTGWTEYGLAEGRFIIGVGRHSAYNRYGKEVPAKALRDREGEDRVQLDIEHMPRHRHRNPTAPGSEAVWALPIARGQERGDYANHGRPTDFEGNGEPHDNMPPYVALQFCTPAQ